MPYTSRLNGVLLVRKLREEESYGEWRVAKDRLVVEQDYLHGLNMKFQTTLEDMAERQHQMAAEEVTLYFRFIQNLRGEITRQEAVVLRQEGVCEDQRILLERAVKERKGVERVEEKRKGAYQDKRFKEEQVVLDEIGGRSRGAH